MSLRIRVNLTLTKEEFRRLQTAAETSGFLKRGRGNVAGYAKHRLIGRKKHLAQAAIVW